MAGVTVTVRTDELHEARAKVNQVIDTVESEDNARPEELHADVHYIEALLTDWLTHLNSVVND